jgi:hypothetical protein
MRTAIVIIALALAVSLVWAHQSQRTLRHRLETRLHQLESEQARLDWDIQVLDWQVRQANIDRKAWERTVKEYEQGR